MTYRELDEASNRLAHMLIWPWCRPRLPGGTAASPVRGSDRGDDGGTQDRRGLSSDRPCVAGDTHRVHGRRRSADRRNHHSRACRPAGRSRPRGDRCRRPRHRGLPVHGIAGAGPRRHRIHHLHVGHDGRAQGRGHHPPQRHPTLRDRELLRPSAPAADPAQFAATQWHSHAFDVSVWEIWGTLLFGGRLVVVPEAVAGSPADLHELLVAEQVNVLTQTPSAVGMLSPDGLDSAALVVAGEACPQTVVDQWAPGRVMINAYGPTETTIYASMSARLTPGFRGAADRLAGLWRGVVRPGQVVAQGAARRGWRAVRRGTRCRHWLLAQAGADRVAVRRMPVRRARDAHVSHRGPGLLGTRRPAAVRRPRRRAGQDPRVPHRTR